MVLDLCSVGELRFAVQQVKVVVTAASGKHPKHCISPVNVKLAVLIFSLIFSTAATANGLDVIDECTQDILIELANPTSASLDVASDSVMTWKGPIPERSNLTTSHQSEWWQVGE